MILLGKLQRSGARGTESIRQQMLTEKFRSSFSLPGKVIRMASRFSVIKGFGEHS